MADTLNKSKLQVRTSFGVTVGEKTPSPSTKLLINHGKPNFTIQKSVTNGSTNGETSTNGDAHADANGNDFPAAKNNNYYPYKTASTVSVKTSNSFNGNIFKPTIVKTTPTTTSASNNNNNVDQQDQQDFEATKVVLRKVQKPNDLPVKDGEDDDVPEFIRRQRRIQERLAKENILDFENRRSGYFTHVMISPTSPNRQSFGETMASPAIVPSLEMPTAPVATTLPMHLKQVEEEEVQEQEEQAPETQQELAVEPVQENMQPEVLNGLSSAHSEDVEVSEVNEKQSAEAVKEQEEDEVNQAIEEVNKAVAGEAETEELEAETESQAQPQIQEQREEATFAAVPIALTEEPETTVAAEQSTTSTTTTTTVSNNDTEVVDEDQPGVVAAVTLPFIEPRSNDLETNQSEENQNEITISHTNALQDGPQIPTPDPSGSLGVNYEPKTVVSFSKDLGSEPNKYPDTVVVVRDNENGQAADPQLQEFSKLKFDIKTDENEVQVTPVLRTDEQNQEKTL